MQASKEAKALAAANSSKGKKKVRSIVNDAERCCYDDSVVALMSTYLSYRNGQREK